MAAVPATPIDSVIWKGIPGPEETDRLLESMPVGGRLLVTGGGWDAAVLSSAARDEGVQVTFVEPGSAPLAAELGPIVSSRMAAWWRDVDLRLGLSIFGSGFGGAVLDDDSWVPADVIVDGTAEGGLEAAATDEVPVRQVRLFGHVVDFIGCPTSDDWVVWIGDGGTAPFDGALWVRYDGRIGAALAVDMGADPWEEICAVVTGGGAISDQSVMAGTDNPWRPCGCGSC